MKNIPNLNTYILLIVFFAIRTSEIKAQWFGQQLIPVDSVLLTTAKGTNATGGYIMGGKRGVRQNGSLLPDFVITKIDANGQYTSSNEFMIEYQINSCGGTPHNCAGVSIVECRNPIASAGINQYYAIAVSSTAGIGFATLDQSGIPVQQLFWDFPPNNINYFALRNPAIRESATANVFYLTCNYQYSTCVMKVDVTTSPPTVLFNNLYFNNTERYQSRDIIESPYNSNEVIVVGCTDMDLVAPNNYWASDAFFTKLDATSGAVLTHSVYNKQYDGDDWFACIEEAQSGTGGSNGYILGGRSHHPINNPTPPYSNINYIQWICKLDPAGAIVWSDLILPANSHNQGFDQEISRVYERQNINNGNFEVYGVAAMGGCQSPTSAANCSTAQVVYKLDDAGANVFTPDEFHYYGAWMHQGTTIVYSDAQITAIETGGTNDGIQVFGNDVGAANFLMTKAYFNGEAGCNQSTTTIQQILQGPDSVRTEQLNVILFPNCPLSNWIIHNVISVSPSTLCSNASLSNGSNAKMFETGVIDNNPRLEEINIFPNPFHSNITISVGSNNKILRLKIFDYLGKELFDYKQVNKTQQVELEFNQLQLENGIYFLDIYLDDSTTTHKKILYSK